MDGIIFRLIRLLPLGQNEKNGAIPTFVHPPPTGGKPKKNLFRENSRCDEAQASHSADGTGVHRLDSPFDFASRQNNRRLRVKASCWPPKTKGQVAAATAPQF